MSAATNTPLNTSPNDARAVIRADGNYFGAVRRRFVVGGIHMSETTYVAGARIPTHQHECPSFFMPLGGAFVEGCGNVERYFSPGDVGYHPSYEPHWLYTTAAARGFAVEVGDAWRHAAVDPSAWDTAPRDLSRSRVSWLLARLYVELRTHDAARPLVVESLGVEIVTELSRERERATRARPRWLASAIELLHTMAADVSQGPPSLFQVARLAGVTPAGLIAAFRRHEGGTPGDYLRTLRLRRARTAVVGTSRPLSAIALDAGFYDQSHFTREFRRVMGVTPSAYRRLVRT